MLYGVDLAKKDIARRTQAVVVEGYTDVMACHLSGVPTAVATCGTAFGDDHIKILRRLLMDQNEFRGEVIFTFDGDAAGQKAALTRVRRTTRSSSRRPSSPSSPDGIDPCELRQHRATRRCASWSPAGVPLFEFAIRTSSRATTSTPPRVAAEALAPSAPIVSRIRDTSMRDDYARQLAGWVGLPDPNEIVQRVRTGPGHQGQQGRRVPGSPARSRSRVRRPPAPTRATPSPQSSASR